jgi:LPXTG-motif cell wall-anchored protein
MKAFIYIVLIIAFLMFYQQNPMFTFIIFVLLLGTYLLFKRKKTGKSFNRGFLFSGNNNNHGDKFNDLITLFILQQYLDPNTVGE